MQEGGGGTGRILRGVGLALLLCATALAQTPPAPFSSAEGRFSVQMPGSPERKEQPIESVGGPPAWNVFEVEAEGKRFVVSYGDFPEGAISTASPVTAIDRMRDGVLRSAGGEVLSDRAITMDGYLGREIDLGLPEKGRIRTRLYLAERRMYGISVSAHEADIGAPSVRRFFESFRLIGQEPAVDEHPARRLQVFLVGLGGLVLLLLLSVLSLLAVQNRRHTGRDAGPDRRDRAS